MRKHVSTTRSTYLAVVLQDASKSDVAFFVIMHYSVRCGHRGLRPMPIVARLCLCVTSNMISSTMTKIMFGVFNGQKLFYFIK